MSNLRLPKGGTLKGTTKKHMMRESEQAEITTGDIELQPSAPPPSGCDSSIVVVGDDSVSAMLHRLHLESYLQKFLDDGVDTLERCDGLELEDLLGMGMKKGHAKQFLTAIKDDSPQ